MEGLLQELPCFSIQGYFADSLHLSMQPLQMLFSLKFSNPCSQIGFLTEISIDLTVDTSQILACSSKLRTRPVLKRAYFNIHNHSNFTSITLLCLHCKHFNTLPVLSAFSNTAALKVLLCAFHNPEVLTNCFLPFLWLYPDFSIPTRAKKYEERTDGLRKS